MNVVFDPFVSILLSTFITFVVFVCWGINSFHYLI